ncbi:expressed unknown protein [Seminavis robusta]|uniref:Uncharacterized protein n=1 Tax=Seminavis robusta TaxID=568900 RepID=A0A9N8EA98_9STRA|nr:expressed unknown protein [Seminavis robusta]|eukprot:Sro802_g204630.1 n/a (137) ;mRNA; f:18104-18514
MSVVMKVEDSASDSEIEGGDDGGAAEAAVGVPAKTPGTASVPMKVGEMETYMQNYYGIPVALRLKGSTDVICPYCNEKHEHVDPGHHVAECDERVRLNVELLISGRSFNPNYGYTVIEYVERDGVNVVLDGEYCVN